METVPYGAAVIISLVVLCACKSQSEQLAEQEAESIRTAHEFNVKRAEAAKAQADELHEGDERRSAVNNAGQAACKRIATDTRECLAGKHACTPAGDDGAACAKYMQANNLEKNPF